MIRRKFGWTNVEVPVIGQGTWMIEGDLVKEARAIETLKLGLDLGMTHIDTAEMYGKGHCEELVAQAIRGRRDEVFLVSKVLPSNASYEGTIKACERSLRRLNTKWIDLYLLHWHSSYPISETMRAMEKLVSEGFVRYIGVSNFDLEELKKAVHALENENITCNQISYNLRNRGIERRLLPYCINKGIAIVGYAPFGHDNFPSPLSIGGKILTDIANIHNRTPRQVALNFLTRYNCIFSIPKTIHPERVKENSESVEWILTEEEIKTIEEAFPLPTYDEPLEII